MYRSAVWFPVAVAAVLAAQSALAQPDIDPKDGRLTIPVTLSPAAAPKPISRYYLRPEYRDLQPGEKIGGFLKVFMEQTVFFNGENELKREKWLKTPLADLPTDIRQQAFVVGGIAYDPPYATMMVFLDQAARYTRTEWNEWFNFRHDGYNALLPEVQKFRSLAPVLVLRMRGEVKNGEFVRAAESVKTLIGMADTLGHHPTLIGNLVGIAIASMTLNAIEEMVQQPGCPNLFWSFADLPVPLMPIRTGLAGERVFVTAQFGPLLRADGPLTAAQLDKHLLEIEKLVQLETKTTVREGTATAAVDELFRNPRLRYTAWSLDQTRVAAARKRLTDVGGLKPDAVKAFSTLQVVVTDDLLQYEVLRDEMFKWVNLPYPKLAQMPDFDATLKDRRKDLILGPVLIAAVQKVKIAEVRTDQRIAYLQAIEAVRLHAYENGGKLPQTLDEIKLPLPLDPVSGKPFEYAVKDGVATLHGAAPNAGQAVTNRYYEIRLRK